MRSNDGDGLGQSTDSPTATDMLRNRLLSALPASELARVQPYLQPVELAQRAVIFEPEQPIQYVYFPESAVVSLVHVLSEGGTVEVGTVGSEGMAGLPIFLSDHRDEVSSSRAVIQIPGWATRIGATQFALLTRNSDPLHRLLLRYTQAFLTQVAQTAACNGTHVIEQRCARWLLMTRDRVPRDEFPLTHEFLAFMLGVRRAGVTVAMNALQDAGILRYTRGSVEILDRTGLERVSCECYRLVRAHFERLLPRAA